ncbi:alpha/beta fold hydrolase [soil metagenome]|nr:alpha/beta hydrolase [Gemmatimonadota bacterium]
MSRLLAGLTAASSMALLLLSCAPAREIPEPQDRPIEGRMIERDAELRMQAEAVGGGPPVVLIGGGLTGWASWEPHAARLAATRTAVRLQLISVQYGLEDRPLPPGYSIRLESRALAGALDALQLREPLDLVAWSYGALATLDFALDHPERVRSLVLIEPPAIWVLSAQGRDDPEVRSLEALGRGLKHKITEADLERFVAMVGLVPPATRPQELPQWPVWMRHRRSLRQGAAAVDHHDDPSRLRDFAQPVLLVTGTGTAPFLRRIHEILAQELPHARTAEMPAGHAPHLVSADRFLAELAAFHARGQP